MQMMFISQIIVFFFSVNFFKAFQIYFVKLRLWKVGLRTLQNTSNNTSIAHKLHKKGAFIE